MDLPADFSIASAETDQARTVRLTGDWTAINLGDSAHRLQRALEEDAPGQIDIREAGRFDTAGALALIRALGEHLDDTKVQARPETKRLLKRVQEAMAVQTPLPKPRWSINKMMERMGRGLVGVVGDFWGTMAFNGHLIATIGRAVLRPHKIRWATVTNLVEQAGLDAIPIVAVTNFFIGAVLAFLAATMLADFGAQVFSVETVGFGVLREFGVVITGVLLAGRSASSFAAEIGSMKMQQEIDAMQTMGVDPFEALVLPRFLAMLFIVPLTFLADLAGLFGGGVVLWKTLDLSPVFFLQRVQESVGLEQFWIGISKAPVIAVVVAAIGCRQGMLVGGDVESLGKRVTAAVVHAIFSIILIDAIFAIIFLELDI